MYSKHSPRIGPADIELLRAVRCGEVHRDDCAGQRRGLWALYRWNGDEVGQSLRRLRRLGLIAMPLAGPPTLTTEGIALVPA